MKRRGLQPIWMLSVVAVLASGCQSPAPLNRPIDAAAGRSPSSRMTLASPDRSSRILLALTFSGGGTRAAAFAYGVLQELHATGIQLEGRSRTLFDEVDLVSSVSGGSFTAAYLGLHGDGIFEDFEDRFLRRNIQLGLVLEVLRPRNWLGLGGVDRSQRAAHYYDRKVFDEATFEQMRRPGAPMVVINATDLSTASRFSFTPIFFERICSDLASYPVSSAVTASSAVPVVFPTVRLRNRAGTCDYEAPEWLTTDYDPGSTDIRNLVREQIVHLSASLDGRDYIHLLDGGISDNLGLMNGIAAIASVRDARAGLRDLGHEGLDVLLLVTVNAQPETQRPWDDRNKTASPLQVISGLSGAEIAETNRLVTRLARTAFSELARELSTPGKTVHFRHVEVDFARIPDPEERRHLRRIETSFNLSDKKVDRLIEAGRRLVRESTELEEAIDLLGAAQPDR